MTRSQGDLHHLCAQATALRRSGKSLREIKEILGPIGDGTLNTMLKDVPPPEWTRRPNAKDHLRDRARELRHEGLSYREIADELDVSKSSISLWVRDIPTPARLLPSENQKRSREGLRLYWEKESKAREEHHALEAATAAAEIGDLSNREVLIAGAVAYWCEGSKRKPHRPSEQVTFINSDPRLISFFLNFLDTADVPRDSLIFRVYIHESADVQAAQQFWMDVTNAPAGQFRKPTLKKHNPKTVRKNTGDDYHGCLRIDVRRSGGLYRRIEGWAAAAMSAA